MEYNLERKVKFIKESEFKNLYSWALQEYDEKGVEVGSPQIPWQWGVDFRATNLEYVRAIEIGRKGLGYLFGLEDEKTKEEDKKRREEISDQERISANLQPTQFRWEEWRDDYLSFSMFGTERELKEIKLDIAVTEKEGHEYCYLWGSPSYTADLDYETREIADCLFINLKVSSEKFAELAKLVRSKQIDACMIRLSGVSGFYSMWSPAVRADNIKILCAGDDQKIEIPEGCDIELAKLGEVQEFSITISSENKMTQKHTASFENEAHEEQEDAINANIEKKAITKNLAGPVQADKKRALLFSIRNLLWAIIIILLTILFNMAG